jgi:GNAT superfamily N-acetyltransferase
VNALPVEPLTRAHDTQQFSSGAPELDRWLQRFALIAEAAGTARTYVLAEEEKILAYYALAAGSVRRENLPRCQAAGTPRHPIPVILLARLAVAIEAQGRGYGSLMLADAAQRALAGARAVGARALIVHARGQEAAEFYEHFGFVPSPSDRLHLAVLMKDLRKTFG